MSEVNERRNARRSFLKLSALASVAGVSSAFGNEGERVIRKASEAELKERYPNAKRVKTICTHCSV
ncbi:twin-arginine translocation signal domain-containing protein, partial [Helicobacter cinaedi]